MAWSVLTARVVTHLAVCALAWAWSLSACADGLQALQDFLQHSRSAQADFVQQVTLPARAGLAPRVKTSSGRLMYARPDRFRIDYLKPEVQTLLGDGRTFCSSMLTCNKSRCATKRRCCQPPRSP